MIHLNIQADSYSELKTKAFVALGLTEPAQHVLPFADAKRSIHVQAEVQTSSIPPYDVVQEAKAKATRAPRTPKEKPEAPKPSDVASQASTGSPVSTVEELRQEMAEENPLGEETKPITHDDAKAMLAKVIAKHGMDRAIAIIKKYGVKMVPQLAAKDLPAFHAECEGALV